MKKVLLSPWHTVCLITVAGVLAACEPSPPAPKAAETAAPAVQNAPPPTTDAVQGMHADAALVAQSADLTNRSSYVFMNTNVRRTTMKKVLLSPWHTVCLITVAGVLAACEPSPPAPKAAETAAPAVQNAPPPTTDAVQGMHADAALVAQSADKAEQLPSTAIPSVDASPLGELKQYVGTYPSDSNMSFLEQGVLAERLKRMLGKEYATLLSNLRTVSPLTEDAGRWFITGNRPHEGGTEAAAVVVDATKNAVRVWMSHNGKVSEYLDPNTAQVPWPRDVQSLLDNRAAAPRS